MFQYFQFDEKTEKFSANEYNQEKKKILDERHSQNTPFLKYSCDDKQRIYLSLIDKEKECYLVCIDALKARVSWKIKVDLPDFEFFDDYRLISSVWTVLFYHWKINKIFIVDTSSSKLLFEKVVLPPKETISQCKKLTQNKLVGFGSNYVEEKKSCSIF